MPPYHPYHHPHLRHSNQYSTSLTTTGITTVTVWLGWDIPNHVLGTAQARSSGFTLCASNIIRPLWCPRGTSDRGPKFSSTAMTDDFKRWECVTGSHLCTLPKEMGEQMLLLCTQYALWWTSVPLDPWIMVVSYKRYASLIPNVQHSRPFLAYLASRDNLQAHIEHRPEEEVHQSMARKLWRSLKQDDMKVRMACNVHATA